MFTLGAVDLPAAFGFTLLLPPWRNFIRRSGIDAAHHGGAWAAHLRNPGLLLLSATGFLDLGVFVATFNDLTFRLSAPSCGLGQDQISLVFAVFLFWVMSSSTAGLMADRFGRGPVLAAGILCMAAGIALTLLPSLPGMIAGVAAVTIGFLVAHPVANGLAGRMAAGSKGHAASLCLLAYHLGSSCLGSAGGWFWTAGVWPAVAGFNAVLLTHAWSCNAPVADRGAAPGNRVSRMKKPAAHDRQRA
ncbi:MFS transporter [Methylobacterium sp. W2]|uniref:MFS transporter n=1 Tax=Methylobacterium sp. W2 TaxID=2598107 RepID=UPI001D0C181D|nr:MFS transporter [Methylobacterium sp. W2]MCC0807352.1 MFS transporter [Methylobacterium sp. W2]